MKRFTVVGPAALLTLALICPSPAEAANCGGSVPDMMIILDQSGSMNSYNKWNTAKSAINNLVAANPNIHFGLMLFASSCNPPVLVGCGPNTHSAIMSVLNSRKPGGGTQAGGALKATRSYLSGIHPGKPKFVLIITDCCSSTSCGNPTPETQQLLNAGIKTFVVGFTSSGTSGVCPTQLNPMAQNGGTALPGSTKFYSASSPAGLSTAFKNIAGQVNCCGNGKIDAGESCDSSIPAGKPGACPTNCNDGKSCTKDSVVGAQCTKKCAYTPITAAINGDGCCPPGATSLVDSDCAKVCGNGLLEAGETCDPGITSGAGKCPKAADCNDANVCTKDSLVGSMCTLKCLNLQLWANVSVKDGCCPPGATSKTDADCPTACGNGILEKGETCDPGITSGKGKCKTLKDCDDKNVCTKDILSGGACTLKCSHVPVKADPTQKDGCCPPGANSKLDMDCGAKCGNGVLETGEKCDTGIKTGPGKCKTLKDCDDKDKCTVDTLVGAGCASHCSNTPNQPDPNKKDGCCPKGHTIKTDADCLPPCGPDRTENCVNLCKGVICPNGQYCQNGKCVKFASNDGGSSAGKEDGGGGTPGADGSSSPKLDASIMRSEAGAPIFTEGGLPVYTEAGTNNNNGGGGGWKGSDGCACDLSAPAGGAGPLMLLALIGLALVARRRSY